MLYVYLMRAGESNYKVGVTKDLIKRVKSIQTSNPGLIELVAARLVDHPFAIERELHEKMSLLATGGGSEWFKMTPQAALDLCVEIHHYPHIELSERIIVRDLLDRQIMWKKTVEKKLDAIINSYQKDLARPYIRRISDDTGAEEKPAVQQNTDELDALLAYEIVKKEGRASTSFLQRKMKIGYSRASRIIDLLEQQGKVGKPNGSSPREVVYSASDGDL